MNSKVDTFINRAQQWREEMTALRSLLLETTLTEEVKWGKPCYALRGKNVALILPFKETCDLLLTKGALIEDPQGLLMRPSENTQSARRLQFTSLAQITKLKRTLKAYLKRAIEVEEAGLEVTYKETAEFPVPEELAAKWQADPQFEKAFKALTPGRQRAYLLHFAGAKQSATRAARIEKYPPQILEGRGMNDDYVQRSKAQKKKS